MIKQMNLEELICSEHSVNMKKKVIEVAEKSRERFSECMNCVFSEDEELARRAAWPLGELAERRQPWFEPYHRQLIDLIEKPHHQAVHRNVLRAYQLLAIPEAEEARLYDVCLNKLQQGVHLPIAIRVFAMSVAFRVVLRHRTLKDEFILVLRDALEDKSPAIQSQGRKIKKQLEKL